MSRALAIRLGAAVLLAWVTTASIAGGADAASPELKISFGTKF